MEDNGKFAFVLLRAWQGRVFIEGFMSEQTLRVLGHSGF